MTQAEKTLDAPRIHVNPSKGSYTPGPKNLVKPCTEAELQKLFYKNLKVLLPGAKRDTTVKCFWSKPDGFVQWESRLCPVEVKRFAFSQGSLDQLLEYMWRYRCLKGIAVAPRLRCELPPDIHFVQLDPHVRSSPDRRRRNTVIPSSM